MKNKRPPFAGVLQILKFNWTFYLLAIGGVAFAFFLIHQVSLPYFVKILFWGGIFLSVFWIFSSLLASYWVYDFSDLYQWAWVKKIIPSSFGKMANLHAGFDETSQALQALFPESQWEVLDVYPPEFASTASLERARSSRNSLSKLANPCELPFSEEIFDGVFLIFAAHEIREAKVRKKFFEELHRILKRGGKLLLVEHLRDFANFVAFGPNVLHFFSKKEWLRCIESASFKVIQEFRITPFVKIFLLEK